MIKYCCEKLRKLKACVTVLLLFLLKDLRLQPLELLFRNHAARLEGGKLLQLLDLRLHVRASLTATDLDIRFLTG